MHMDEWKPLYERNPIYSIDKPLFEDDLDGRERVGWHKLPFHKWDEDL